MIKQYGAIPFIHEGGEIKVVLVTSANGNWIFPKGNLEKKLGTCATAKLEAFEEAGVKGVLHAHHIYRANVIIRGGKKTRLMLYPLEIEEVFEEWPEEYRRQREIVNLSDAGKLIESEALLRCLQHFARDFY